MNRLTRALLAIGLAVPSSAFALDRVPHIVDQSFMTAPNLGYGFNEGGWIVGQSFTASLSGRLSAVRVEMVDESTEIETPHLSLFIYDAPAGVPAPAPLMSMTLPTDESRFTSLVALTSPVPIFAGHQYLLAAHYIGTAPSPGVWTWRGRTGDGSAYPRGQVFVGNTFSPTNVNWSARPAEDLFFQTVVRIPEPQSWQMVLAGAAACLTATVRRQSKT